MDLYVNATSIRELSHLLEVACNVTPKNINLIAKIEDKLMELIARL